MKRIIFFSKNLNTGGMEKALISLLNELIEHYEITLVLEKKEGILLNDLSEKITIEEYCLSGFKSVVLRKIHNFTKRIIWSISNYHKYDFSCNYATYSIIGSRLAQIASKNSSFYIHSNYYELFNHNKNKIIGFFEPHRINNFEKIIFVSKESKKGMEKIIPEFKDNYTVINNLLDYKNILQLSKKEEHINFKFINNNYYFIFIGRLENESKNLDLLISSFELVVKKSKKHKLLIVGDGIYKKNLENRIKNKHLEDSIFLVGETKNPYPYLKKSNCLILTSNYEGFPVVYLESLLLNKNIMTTIPTSDSFIDIRNYCILLKKDKFDISNKILKYKDNLEPYNLDFESMNKKKLKKIIEVIERN